MHELDNKEGLGPSALAGVNLSFRGEGRRQNWKDTWKFGGSKKTLKLLK